jgi:hypothetical protein
MVIVLQQVELDHTDLDFFDLFTELTRKLSLVFETYMNKMTELTTDDGAWIKLQFQVQCIDVLRTLLKLRRRYKKIGWNQTTYAIDGEPDPTTPPPPPERPIFVPESDPPKPPHSSVFVTEKDTSKPPAPLAPPSFPGGPSRSSVVDHIRYIPGHLPPVPESREEPGAKDDIRITRPRAQPEKPPIHDNVEHAYVVLDAFSRDKYEELNMQMRRMWIDISHTIYVSNYKAGGGEIQTIIDRVIRSFEHNVFRS